MIKCESHCQDKIEGYHDGQGEGEDGNKKCKHTNKAGGVFIHMQGKKKMVIMPQSRPLRPPTIISMSPSDSTIVVLT